MVEIAISLAIIGIALVAIIGVLPIGMNTQRDNREETIINQDATILMETIRNGGRGQADLTNYIYAITNYSTTYNDKGVAQPTSTNGYSYVGSSQNGAPMVPFFPITNNSRIIGLLSTPEFTDVNGSSFNSFSGVSYTSNHIVAYVRSLSGPAVEKPPQDNDIVRSDSFGYRLLCVNAPVATFIPPLWVARVPYNVGDQVSFIPIATGQPTFWQAILAGSPPLPPQPSDIPGVSARWVRVLYPQELAANLHELRLTFLWPQLPNGNLGPGRQTFRTTIAGQVVHTNEPIAPVDLYFYQSQSFANATNAP